MFSSIYFIVISFIIFLYTFTNLTLGYFYLNPKLSAPLISLKPKVTGQKFPAAISAKSFLIIDEKTKVKLGEKDIEEKRSIASLTKLMSALVFLQTKPAWQKMVTIKISDFKYGSSRYLRLDDQITIKDLFYVGLIGSDNVAMTALIRTTSLSEAEFMTMMNQRARLLGMSDTYFKEPTGVSSENLSTADDLSQLVLKSFTIREIQEATSLANYQIILPGGERREVKNTNKLLNNNDLKVLSGKTGFLEEAGYCLISEIEGKDKQKIIIILLGSENEESRFSETKTLAKWVFENFIFY